MDGIEYSISFNTIKAPNSVLFISHTDTLELVKIIEKTSSGKVFWEIFEWRSYEDNGQPVEFFIQYYDTTKPERYPDWPTSITNYKNDRKKNIFYLKHGFENEYYIAKNGFTMISTRRKWRNGKLKKTIYYEED
jgi:hypothetical protein